MKFKESKAIYLQIAERLCDEILSNRYKAEERVPSVREYAATVEVNSNTVMRSYEYLQSQEIIYNKRGVGYFVSPDAREKILISQKTYFMNEQLEDFFKQIFTLDISIEDIVKMYNEYIEKHSKQ